MLLVETAWLRVDPVVGTVDPADVGQETDAAAVAAVVGRTTH